MSVLGNNIRKFRTDAGMTQAELAEAVGTTSITISRYESGARTPSPDMLRNIALALGGVNLYYFFGEEGREEYKHFVQAREIAREIAKDTGKSNPLFDKALDFGIKLKRIREENKITQEELVEHLKGLNVSVTLSAINMWEQGRTLPNYDTIKKIADFFNIETETLLDSDYDRSAINITPISLFDTNKYDEIKELINEYHKDPELRMLFDAAKGAKKESLALAAEMLRQMKKHSE